MTAPGDARSGFAEVEGGRLFYEVAGAGPPLVLVHAGIADARMWDDQFPVFARRHRVFRYDLRGYGRSPMVAGRFAHRRDLAALLRSLGIGRASLVGCSKGGGMALDFALEHPALVASLVLVGAAPGGFDSGDPPPRQWDELVAAFEAGDLERSAELEAKIWVDGPSRPPDRVDPAVRERVKAMDRIALATEAAALGEEEELDPPAVGRLAEVAVPTLVVVGDLDQPEILRAGELLAASIPGAEQAVLAGTAHLPNMERPAEFNRIVLEFLARRDGPVPSEGRPA